MNILFVHDTKFKLDINGNLYTGGSFNKDVWQRYLNYATHLTVIANKENKIYSQEEAKVKFNLFFDQKMNFIETHNVYNSIMSFFSIDKIRKNHKLIEDEVKKNDCIIVRLPSKNGLIAIRYARKHKKKYLIEVVGCPWDSLWNHSWKGKFIAPYSTLKMRKAIKESKYVLYVTNYFLQKRYPTLGKQIGCSDVSLKSVELDILSKRIENIKLNKNKIIIGTTAAIDVKYKGQKYVIKALGKLKKQGITNFEYQLVGGGSKDYLEKIASKNNVSDQVKFLGALTHEEVFSWLDTIDVYVQPSKQEGLPRALIEAMSRGLPAFGSNIGGIPELIGKEQIFQHNKKCINRICEILNSFNTEKLLRLSEENYNKALLYNKDSLNKERDLFIKSFIEDN